MHPATSGLPLLFDGYFYMIGIYKITNPKGRIYIGQSVDITKRFNQYKLLHCKKQTILYNSFVKYGLLNHKFEVITECDIERLNEQERYFQDVYNVLSKTGLNCTLTKASDRSGEHSIETKLKIGEAGKGKKRSAETKRKISEAQKGRIQKPCSAETRLKLSEAAKGRKPPSAETRQKMREAQKGKKRSAAAKLKCSESLKGNTNRLGDKHSAETRQKMSESKKGIKFSTATRKKLSEAGKARIRKPHSAETKLKMSEAQKARRHNEITKHE